MTNKPNPKPLKDDMFRKTQLPSRDPKKTSCKSVNTLTRWHLHQALLQALSDELNAVTASEQLQGETSPETDWPFKARLSYPPKAQLWPLEPLPSANTVPLLMSVWAYPVTRTHPHPRLKIHITANTLRGCDAHARPHLCFKV